MVLSVASIGIPPLFGKQNRGSCQSTVLKQATAFVSQSGAARANEPSKNAVSDGLPSSLKAATRVP